MYFDLLPDSSSMPQMTMKLLLARLFETDTDGDTTDEDDTSPEDTEGDTDVLRSIARLELTVTDDNELLLARLFETDTDGDTTDEDDTTPDDTEGDTDVL